MWLLNKNVLSQHFKNAILSPSHFKRPSKECGRFRKKNFNGICNHIRTSLIRKLSIKTSEFALKIKRPFAVRYNPYNQSIEILSNAQQVANIVSDLKGDICIIFDALKKMEGVKDTDRTNVKEKIKLARQYKKLEEAFRNLSLDLHD